MKKILLIVLIIIITIAILIGLKVSTVTKTPTKDLPFLTYRVVKIESCFPNEENNCRVLAENNIEYLSFKIDYRFKDLIQPQFQARKDGACLLQIKVTDGRELDFPCIPIFSKPK